MVLGNIGKNMNRISGDYYVRGDGRLVKKKMSKLYEDKECKHIPLSHMQVYKQTWPLVICGICNNKENIFTIYER